MYRVRFLIFVNNANQHGGRYQLPAIFSHEWSEQHMKVQLQAKYDPAEDRILFRVSDGNQPRGIWLTRRYTILMLKMLGQFIEQDADLAAQSGSRERAEVRDFKAQHALKTADFSQPFDEGSEATNLAVEVFPVGFELTYSIKDSRLSVSMKPKSDTAIQLGMDRAMAFNLIAMIGKAAAAGKWDLPHGMLGPKSSANDGARPRIIN